MANSKQQRRAAAGPQMDPQMISMQMSPLPGSPPGPGNMNSHPQNVPGMNEGASSMNPNSLQRSIYNDGMYQYPQLGTASVNPMMVPRSPVPGNAPMGQKLNGGMAFGMQQQPPAEMSDQMESMRLGGEAQMKYGLAASAMGPIGVQAQPGMPTMAGGMPGDMPGTSGPPLMQPMNSMNAMTPGATKQVKGKGKMKQDRVA